MSNSVDPDETAHYEQSYLDLCYLQKPILSLMTVKELKPSWKLEPVGRVSVFNVTALFELSVNLDTVLLNMQHIFFSSGPLPELWIFFILH